MLAATSKAKEIRRHYIKMEKENITHELGGTNRFPLV
jgi:hypothetical protein